MADEAESALSVEQIFEQARDDQGRFTAKSEEQPKQEATVEQPAIEQPAVTVEPVVEKPKPEADAGIPPWRLREEAEARRQAEEQTRQLQSQIAALNRRIGQNRQPEKLPDLVEQPEEYAAAIERRLTQSIEQRFVRSSISRAGRVHGETFQKAWTAFDQSNDDALFQKVRYADDPGEEIMAWYRERETLREIGGDPATYRKKLLGDEAFRKEALSEQTFVDAILGNPEVRKRAAELWRIEAQQTQRPGNVTNLPSLSSAPAARVAAETLGGSDSDRFDQVWAGNRK